MADPLEPERAEHPTDLSRADELLRRTREFLERCAEDPSGAFEAEDPDDLRRRLHGLTHPSLDPSEEEGEGPALERRRSA